MPLFRSDNERRHVDQVVCWWAGTCLSRYQKPQLIKSFCCCSAKINSLCLLTSNNKRDGVSTLCQESDARLFGGHAHPRSARLWGLDLWHPGHGVSCQSSLPSQEEHYSHRHAGKSARSCTWGRLFSLLSLFLCLCLPLCVPSTPAQASVLGHFSRRKVNKVTEQSIRMVSKFVFNSALPVKEKEDYNNLLPT